MWRVYVNNGRNWMNQQAYRTTGLPGWVLWTASVAAFLVIAIPLIALVVAAVLVGGLVFLVLGLIATVVNGISRLFGGLSGRSSSSDDGRVNVRVMHRSE